MSIQSINGKTVYVVQAEPTAPAKTSSGVGWAQYVTHLRWQLWERTQQDVMNELKLGSDSHNDQVKEIQSQRLYLRRLSRDKQKALDRLSRDEASAVNAQNKEKAKQKRENSKAYTNFKNKEAIRKSRFSQDADKAARKASSGSDVDRLGSKSKDAHTSALAKAGSKVSTPDSYAKIIEQVGNLETTSGGHDAGEVDQLRSALITSGIDNARANADINGAMTADQAEQQFMDNIGEEWKKSQQRAKSAAAGPGADGEPAKFASAKYAGAGRYVADPGDRSGERQKLEAELAKIREELSGLVTPEFDVPNITEASRRRFADTIGDNTFGAEKYIEPEAVDKTDEIMNAFIEFEQSGLGPEADELDRVEAKRAGIQEAIKFVDASSREIRPTKDLKEEDPVTVAQEEPVINDIEDPSPVPVEPRTPFIEGLLPQGDPIPEATTMDVLEPAGPLPTKLKVDTSTPEARQEKYKDDVTKEGMKLLKQNFERFRKADLSEADRRKKVSPYVFVVEKLIGGNTPGEVLRAFKEISQTYSNESDVRKAHVYLMALSEHLDKENKPEAKK